MSIRTGLDVLLQNPALLARQRIGLISNASGVTGALQRNIDALREAGVSLVACFGPEHGIASAAADAQAVPSGRDARTGLPVYSLYGETRRPTSAMLAGIDALVFDLQDVGARFYTFTATLANALQACAEHRVRLVVLDRPNPLNGVTVEGPMLEPALQSFIGHGPLPIRYGLTAGELARFYNAELGLGAELEVIPMQGWQRTMWYDETGLQWVPPSPGMPHFATAIVYPGMCLVEGANLSEGRGTALPFEITGAPWLDGDALAAALNAQALPGARLRAHTFTPDAGRFAGQVCHGIQVHVTDRDAFQPVLTGLAVLAACRAQAPDRFEILSTSWEGRPPHLDLLAGTPRARQALEANQPVQNVLDEGRAAVDRYVRTREKYLLY